MTELNREPPAPLVTVASLLRTPERIEANIGTMHGSRSGRRPHHIGAPPGRPGFGAGQPFLAHQHMITRRPKKCRHLTMMTMPRRSKSSADQARIRPADQRSAGAQPPRNTVESGSTNISAEIITARFAAAVVSSLLTCSMVAPVR